MRHSYATSHFGQSAHWHHLVLNFKQFFSHLQDQAQCNSLPVVYLRQLYNKVEYQLSQCPTTSDNYSCDVWSRCKQDYILLHQCYLLIAVCYCFCCLHTLLFSYFSKLLWTIMDFYSLQQLSLKQTIDDLFYTQTTITVYCLIVALCYTSGSTQLAQV